MSSLLYLVPHGMTELPGVWQSFSLQQSNWTNLHDDSDFKSVKMEAVSSLKF